MTAVTNDAFKASGPEGLRKLQKEKECTQLGLAKIAKTLLQNETGLHRAVRGQTVKRVFELISAVKRLAKDKDQIAVVLAMQQIDT